METTNKGIKENKVADKKVGSMNQVSGRKFQNRPTSKAEDFRDDEWQSKMIDLRRVTRVMAGGKRFKFRACVVVGNEAGKVGVGVAKGADVAQAISKATNQAKRRMVEVVMINGTIPHAIQFKYGSSQVLLKPAPPGAGIIAGGAVRTVVGLAGIKNISGKILSRSGNKVNNSRATLGALNKLKALKISRVASK